MATSAADKLIQTCPTTSEWTGVIATDPVAAGVETEDVVALDMGASPGANTNTDAKAVSVEFPSSFDDTINTNGARIYMLNNPQFAGHTWAAEFNSAALFPAGTLDAVLAGASAATIGGSPWTAPALHKLATTAEYDGTANRINTVILQLQLGAAPTAHDQSLSIHAAPILVVETPRTDYDIQDRILREDQIMADVESGHLFSYPNYRVYQVDNVGTSTEQWNLLDSVREDSVEIAYNKELVSWEKGRPKITFHQAISDVTASITFTTGQTTPELRALSQHTSASRNSTDRYVETIIGGAPCLPGTRETAWVVECITLGGFVDRFFIPRGTLKMTGGGGGDFQENTFEVTALGTGTDRDVAKFRTSDTPSLTHFIPILYKAAA